MPDERTQQAIARIEAAIARIERRPAARAPAPVPPPQVPDLATVGLLERHARLRTGAVDALARLDRLIAERQG